MLFPEGSRWDRISDLLTDAAMLPPHEQEPYLRGHTNDPELLREILSLLAVQVPSSDILEHPVSDWYRLDDPSNGGTATLPRLLTGELLSGRFQIEGFLGRGGMGEVYSAQDLELDEMVALKLLNPDLAAQPSFLDRFRREIRLARRITHPNVARVFDLVQDPTHALGPLNFYIMELLEGETLAARLRRAGPIPEPEARVIARQLASGLAAAHAANVIHRDFKPANVILRKGRPVITDFGLAAPIQTDGADDAVRTTSLQLGTPGYVAPEQWAGRPVSVATDVYTFGIVLQEMVTACHPNAPQTITIPPAWVPVIQKCLQLEPQNRWRTPEEAIRALDRARLSRRSLLCIAGVGTVVSLSVYASRFLWWRAGTSPVAYLLMAPVTNTTGDARFGGATELLYGQLDQSPQLHLVTPTRRDAVLGQMGLPRGSTLDVRQTRELAWRLQTPAILYSTVGVLGSDYVLQVQLEMINGRPDSHRVVAERSFRAAGPQDLTQQFRAAAAWARASAGEAATQIAETDRPPEEVTTSSWEALAAYSKAMRAAKQEQEEQAEQHLKEALAIDPKFVAAQQELADLYISRYRFAEGYTAWETAVRLLESRHVTFRERYRTETLYYEDTFQRDRQLAAVRAWSIHYPGDEPAHHFLGSCLFHRHQFDEALREFEAAWQIEPTARVAAYAVAVGWMKNDRALSDHWLEQMTRRWTGGLSWKLSGQTAFLRGDYATSLGSFRNLARESDPDLRDQGHALLTALLAEAGRIDLAKESCAKHVAEARSWSRPAVLARRLLHLAYLKLLLRDAAHVSELVDEAGSLEKGPRLLRELATVYRLFGDRTSLTRLRDNTAVWPDLPVFAGSRAWIEAELITTLRGPAAASSRYDAALSGSSPYIWPPVAIETGLNLNRLPANVPFAPALWYMAQLHWPGLVRATGALAASRAQLERFGSELTESN